MTLDYVGSGAHLSESRMHLSVATLVASANSKIVDADLVA